MAVEDWSAVVALMRDRGIAFADGLTDAEVEEVEARFGFRFPEDLRAFLQTALPRGEEFPDWRTGSEPALREWLDHPLQGILFDLEFNGFWLKEWGARPSSLIEAKQAVRDLVAAAPQLIPIYIHRMMPDEPHTAGNPVFSVHGTDIIVYGTALEHYLRLEFDLPGPFPGTLLFDLPGPIPALDEVRLIRFWDIDRFQEVSWADGSCIIDPRLQEQMTGPALAGSQGSVRRKWWQFWR